VKFSVLFAATAMAAILATGAQAATTTVNNTELGALPAPGSTVTEATGTRSTNPVDGGANRVSETFAAGEWQARNVGGDGVVGITTDYARSGNGSAYFSTVDGNSKADLEYYFTQPLALSSFEGGSYDWYRDGASGVNGILAPSLRLLVTDGQQSGMLIFEPYYQAAPGNVATDTWVTSIFSLSSVVWSNSTSTLTVPAGTGTCAVGCFSSLQNWAASNPNLNVLGLSTGVGSGWNGGGFKGAVDNVSVTFGGQTQTFNFEVSAVPEPATWAMMIVGFGLVGAAARRRGRIALAA